MMQFASCHLHENFTMKFRIGLSDSAARNLQFEKLAIQVLALLRKCPKELNREQHQKIIQIGISLACLSQADETDIP
jgi:hypothetical protein